MLAIFDIDGTLCDTQEVEGRCFVEAISRVTGVRLETLDWTVYDEPTSSGIVREVLKGDPDLIEKERAVEKEFVRLLELEQPKHPADFSPLPGAVEFIERLQRDERWTVGIATGGFALEAAFKLRCCGIAIQEFPHATSSDTPRRRDIIPLCAKRAGVELNKVVYFGDAPWDVKVTTALKLPLIGIGRRVRELRALGVVKSYRDYSDQQAVLEGLSQLHESGR
ncbi:HAD family hydrolase [Haloferula sp.]|uniref:HAD family hydrolase n=1 Tax=Haloferula sp. TaxID=2497595 RepID=UPI00329E27AC